jgi:hypothetical protein
MWSEQLKGQNPKEAPQIAGYLFFTRLLYIFSKGFPFGQSVD